LDRLLHRNGLDTSALTAFSHPIVQIEMRDGTWTLNAARVRRRRVYWTDNRGSRRLVAIANEGVFSADREVTARMVGHNGLCDPKWIIESELPLRAMTTIQPHRFLLDVFASVFALPGVSVWSELERRFGPKRSVSKEERAQIHREVSAPVRSWILGLGIPGRVRDEVRRRERRPMIQRWFEEVVENATERLIQDCEATTSTSPPPRAGSPCPEPTSEASPQGA
jgi:hypothetical protein